MKTEEKFNAAMADIYEKAKAFHYNASRFNQMLRRWGGVETARRLLKKKGISSGYQRLIDCGQLRLTFEAIIWDNPEFHALFTKEELMTVKARLGEFGYFDR